MTGIYRGIGTALAAALLATGCAHDGYSDRGYGYNGAHGYAPRYANPFRGSGARRLDPWLAETRQGQQFVMDHYPLGPGYELSRDDAEGANAFFRRWADTDRNYRLTDEEIRTALVHAGRNYGMRSH